MHKNLLYNITRERNRVSYWRVALTDKYQFNEMKKNRKKSNYIKNAICTLRVYTFIN